MKILHVCLSNFYIDGYAYQENMLVAEHVRAGHSVHVLASTETFGTDGKLTYINSSSYMGSDGAIVERLPYRFTSFSHFFARKFRAYVGLTARLEEIAPDVIVFHGLCGFALLEVAKYVKRNPRVVLYADSHEDFNTSARGLLSKWLLHFMCYRVIFQISLPEISKVFCISKETVLFVRDFYGCPEIKIEFLPLGGKIFSDEEYN
ncbi:MAG: glycosyltransferase family 4 protein [Betaproteobacteria bacterium]|nr:glycosyltransferase family 4 protein [Betaproteobacteria bacterium]